MRRRWQRGGLTSVNGRWIGKYRDAQGRCRSKTLGAVSRMTKTAARKALLKLLPPEYANQTTGDVSLRQFVETAYLPIFRLKWKASTAGTNEDRLRRWTLNGLGDRQIASIRREGLQARLAELAQAGLSRSVLNHVRFDFSQIFKTAVAEGVINHNPATMLFSPREIKPDKPKRVATLRDLGVLLDVMPPRELLVCRLVLIDGLRPGEALGLKWQDVAINHLRVTQRVYRGKIDTPKSRTRSTVHPALSRATEKLLQQWREASKWPDASAWVFPSESGKLPVSRDNLWRRNIAPRLKPLGLQWITFAVMRRTNRTLMHARQVDPKAAADQLGHSLDVSMTEYVQSGLETRRKAVDDLDRLLGN